MYVRLILTYPGIVKLILCIVNYFLAVSKEDVIVLVSMGVYSVKSHPLLFEKTTGKRGFIRASGAVGLRSEQAAGEGAGGTAERPPAFEKFSNCNSKMELIETISTSLFNRFISRTYQEV